jgi:hypothetical protein
VSFLLVTERIVGVIVLRDGVKRVTVRETVKSEGFEGVSFTTLSAVRGSSQIERPSYTPAAKAVSPRLRPAGHAA